MMFLMFRSLNMEVSNYVSLINKFNIEIIQQTEFDLGQKFQQNRIEVFYMTTF